MQQLNLATVQEGTYLHDRYIKTWIELKSDRRAVTALEYALIAGVIVATILVGFQVLASDLSNKFSSIGGSLYLLILTDLRLAQRDGRFLPSR